MIDRLPVIAFSDVQKWILAYIFHNTHATRSELVEASGLTLMTITKTVSALIKDGLLVSDGTISGGVGRRKNLLTLNPAHKYILGIDIGYASLKVGVVQFGGQMLQGRVIAGRQRFITRGVSFDEMIEAVQALIDRYGHDRFLGIGASISGMVDVSAGKVLFSPNINGFENRDFARELSCHFGLPVFLDTSARCMAAAEVIFGAGRGVREQILVSMGYGSIAAGVVHGGSIFHGEGGFAGEMGHIRVEGKSGMSPENRCTCGSMGCLELHASLYMVMRRIELELTGYNGYSVVKTLMGDGKLTPELMAEAFRKGDTIVIECVERAAQQVGRVLAALVNFADPSQIVLSGGFVWHLPEIVGMIEREVKNGCLVPIRNRLSVEKSCLDEFAPLQGSALQLAAKYLQINFGNL